MSSRIRSIYPVLALAAVAAAAAAAASPVVIQAPTFSTEGRTETIEVVFDRPSHGAVELEVYTFHYPLRPDLALEEDTWAHERQMRYMEDIEAGRRTAPDPDPADPRLAAILAASSVERFPMTGDDHRTFRTAWKATHGRVFFRVRTGGRTLEAVESARVHCAHIDSRSVEKLKEALQRLGFPLAREHGEMADRLIHEVRSVFTTGHSFRHMLVHHEVGLGELDTLLGELERAIAARRWPATREIAERLEREIAEREGAFLEVQVASQGDRLRLTLEDRIKGFDFAAHPDTAILLKRGPAISPERSHTALMNSGAHSTGGSGHDPAEHQAMMGFDREELVRGAVELARANGGFEVSRNQLGSEPRSWTLVALYGEGQQYYLTRAIELPAMP
jgi:hypothetical protein